MKKLTVFLVVIAILLTGGYLLIKSGEWLRHKVLSAMGEDAERVMPTGDPQATEGDGPKEEYRPGDEVALYFKNGSTMIGGLIKVTKDEYIINWKGQETVVFAEQIDRMGSPKEALGKKTVLSDEEISEWWPFDNDIVVRLTNRVVLDAIIKDVDKDILTLLYPVDGGSMEQDIERSRVEHLIFKPIKNEESRKIEQTLKGFLPDMTFHTVGNFTVVSDSDITWVREFSQVLRNAYSNLYIEFFDLLKTRKPHVQNYVVIFDEYFDFFEHAIADGVPAWAVSGYFSPEDKTLYLFNMLGKNFSEILFQAMVGESGRTIDDIVDMVEARVDKRYHVFIKGQAKTIKNKYWKAYSYYKDSFRQSTLSTLRHEFAHQLFHNWGLQNIILSSARGNEEELIEKKKEFLETEDYDKKAELVKKLMALRSEEVSLDMRAANSWLAEGIATYCEGNPIGGRNDKWLFLYQEMAKSGAVNPIEALTVYKIGSFPGVSSQAMLHLYAQSWAYVTFLMDKYPKEFMEYQSKMAEKTAEGYQDVDWLLKCLGKDSKAIDAEFTKYMSQFEELESPFVRHFDRLYTIFNE